MWQALVNAAPLTRAVGLRQVGGMTRSPSFGEEGRAGGEERQGRGVSVAAWCG
jgi:hypothetical protein